MTDSDPRDNEFETRRQQIVQKGFSLYGVGRTVRQGFSRAGLVCAALGCTNPGGAFTSERDDQIYEFCSEACRAAFDRPTR